MLQKMQKDLVSARLCSTLSCKEGKAITAVTLPHENVETLDILECLILH